MPTTNHRSCDTNCHTCIILTIVLSVGFVVAIVTCEHLVTLIFSEAVTKRGCTNRLDTQQYLHTTNNRFSCLETLTKQRDPERGSELVLKLWTCLKRHRLRGLHSQERNNSVVVSGTLPSCPPKWQGKATWACRHPLSHESGVI